MRGLRALPAIDLAVPECPLWGQAVRKQRSSGSKAVLARFLPAENCWLLPGPTDAIYSVLMRGTLENSASQTRRTSHVTDAKDVHQPFEVVGEYMKTERPDFPGGSNS